MRHTLNGPKSQGRQFYEAEGRSTYPHSAAQRASAQPIAASYSALPIG